MVRVYELGSLNELFTFYSHLQNKVVRIQLLYRISQLILAVVIDQVQATKFALDIARGMSFLHSLDPLIQRYYLSSKHVVVDEELTARISMADTKFSFQENGRLYSPAWMSPDGQ